MLESMQDKGLPLIDDLFTTGEKPNGCGSALRSVWDGVRSTAADFVSLHEDRIDVWVNTMVDRVIVEERDGEIIAIGVEVLDREKRRSVVKARREVVVSGGIVISCGVSNRLMM